MPSEPHSIAVPVDPIRLGCTVRLSIDTGGASAPRVAQWRLADRTDRAARELGLDTAIARALMGRTVDDEIEVPSADGGSFSVAVLAVFPPSDDR